LLKVEKLIISSEDLKGTSTLLSYSNYVKIIPLNCARVETRPRIERKGSKGDTIMECRTACKSIIIIIVTRVKNFQRNLSFLKRKLKVKGSCNCYKMLKDNKVFFKSKAQNVQLHVELLSLSVSINYTSIYS